MKRREFLKASAGASGGATVATAATGSASAAEGGGGGGKTLPDFGGYLSEANNGDAVKDLRGNKEVTVTVGAGSQNLAFDPAGIWIDPGTTVKWEWTGKGGNHNVHATKGASFESDLYSDSGVHFQHTFEEGGIVEYQCDPHAPLGMLGAVAVGDDVPTKTVSTPAPAGGGEPNPEHMGVPFQPHYVGVATLLGMVVSLVFTFYFLKYGTSPHTGYPEDR